MVVRHHEAVSGNHEARALRLCRSRIGALEVAEFLREILEEVVERVILGEVRQKIAETLAALGCDLWRGTRHGNADDGGLHLFDDVGEGQRRAAERGLHAVGLLSQRGVHLRKPEAHRAGECHRGDGGGDGQLAPFWASREDRGACGLHAIDLKSGNDTSVPVTADIEGGPLRHPFGCINSW